MIDPIDELLVQHPLPEADGGKESKGNLVIVGGAPSCPGAPILAGRAALRCGAGRVQLVVHPSLAAPVGVAFPEALVLGWDPAAESMPEEVRERIASAAAVIVGPGLADEAPSAALDVGRYLGPGVLVVDALAITCLSDPALPTDPAPLAAPNPKEASRLLEADLDDDTDLGELATRVAKLLGGPTAVRGEQTVVDDGDGHQWLHRSDAPGLGTPGSGDTLIGALGAFLARGAEPLSALGWAVAVHGRAGELLSERAPVGYLASEIADAMPAALAALTLR